MSEDSTTLEEFYAIGIRSPYSTYFDPTSQKIWLADVGAGTREELSVVERGDNLQWPYLEGSYEIGNHEKPDQLIGKEKTPFFEYERSLGACIIGGGIYRGSSFPALNEKYLFADFTNNKLMALTNTGNSTSEEEYETLLSGLGGFNLELPETPFITGVYPLSNGEVLLTVTGIDFFDPGCILRLRQKVVVPDPPSLLSDLDVFTNLQDLTPIPGIIPYRVNAPLWSDRATKKRWLAVPNGGQYDSMDERIFFASSSEWVFPEGTVFIKHFDLPLSTTPDGPMVPLETRFFVIGEGGQGYGLTYKWNEDGTDAQLLGGGTSKEFEITDIGGTTFSQVWDFPSRGQCMTCHTENAKYVLGVKTHQLNGDLHYPSLGRARNQLEYWSDLGLFHRPLTDADRKLKAYPIEDASADLELRIRSYLDANCASCHRLEGIPTVSMDLRFEAPLRLQNIVNFETQSQASELGRLIVKPGDHVASELWVRDASINQTRMPPLGRQLVDQIYIDSLAKWIDQLAENAGRNNALLLYPNPTSGPIALRVNDGWEPPFMVRIYTINGVLSYQKEFDTRAATLDFSGQAAGTYLLEISNGEEKELSKFILH